MNKIFLALFLITLPVVACAQQATVKFEGERFPLRLTVESPSAKEVLMRPGATKVLGKVTVLATAYPTDGYFVVARYSVNDGPMSGIVLGEHALELKDKDVLTVHSVGIIPPTNAALVSTKRGAVLISLMFPSAVPNPEAFDGKEEFRSSAMFVAKYGSKTVAERLAKQAIEGTQKDSYGNFRGDQQISVIRESNADGTVVEAQAKMTTEELTEAIYMGLIELQIRGWNTEVLKAKELLKK